MNPELVYLVQTDTTAGFASKNKKRLAEIKTRPADKKFLCTYASLKSLSSEARVQKNIRKQVRRAKKTSFAYSDGYARRVVFDGEYHFFLNRFDWMYSTSANPGGKEFSKAWAENQCDVIVYTDEKLESKNASSILKFSKTKIKRVR